MRITPRTGLHPIASTRVTVVSPVRGGHIARSQGGNRLVKDLDAADVGPGCMMLNSRHQGYLFACPGCAMHLSLPVSGPQAWTVTAGDVEHPETLTLAPSILHPARTVVGRALDGVTAAADGLHAALDAYEQRGGDRCAAPTVPPPR